MPSWLGIIQSIPLIPSPKQGTPLHPRLESVGLSGPFSVRWLFSTAIIAKERNRNNQVRLHVFFTPAEIITSGAQQDDIYIVIDLIRATTTLAAMFDQGAARVFVAGSVAQARKAKQQFPGRLLCGERNVKPVPGFD